MPGQKKIDQLFLGKKSCIFTISKQGGGEGGVYWIELMGSLFKGRRREGPIVCIILLASSLSWFIIVGKTSKLFLLGFFLPIYTGFLYVCMYGWARALRGEAKSSSNKRSTCSVTTWSSVISAGSPPFCSSFLRAYALSQQHIFLAVVAFFQNFWKQGLLR